MQPVHKSDVLLGETDLSSFHLQCRSKVSYHLSLRFLRDESCFSWDISCFSRALSRFSRESLMRLVWHILHIRNRLRVTIWCQMDWTKLCIARLLDSCQTKVILNVERNYKQSSMHLNSRNHRGKELILRVLLTLNDQNNSATYNCLLCNNR